MHNNIHEQIVEILAGVPLPPELQKRIKQTVLRDVTVTTGPNPQALADGTSSQHAAPSPSSVTRPARSRRQGRPVGPARIAGITYGTELGFTYVRLQ